MTDDRTNLIAAANRRGFMLVELLISSTLIVLTLGAIVAVSYATTEGWRCSDRAQTLHVTTYRTSAQLYRLLRSGNYVGLATADDQQSTSPGIISASPGAGAAVMFWAENGIDDAKIEAAEVALIEHDRSTNTLKLYQLPKTAPNANTRFYTNDISTSTAAKAFKNVPGVQSRLLASGVTSVSFRVYYTNDSVNRQSVDFKLLFERQRQVRSEFGTAVLRSPIKPDDT